MNCKRCGDELEAGKSRCSCGAWNVGSSFDTNDLVRLSEVEDAEIERAKSGPWDLCLGGGMVGGSTILIGGEPGAGKSTLGLHIADHFSTLYIAAEESPQQIKGRANRIGISNEDIFLYPSMGNDDTKISDILSSIDHDLVILDSLPGFAGIGPSHDAEALLIIQLLKNYAVEKDAYVIILDHVTKDDLFAGRMTLQHEVDVTISLTSEDAKLISSTGNEYDRILRTIKNRHGASGVEVKFLMTEKGLQYDYYK